MSLDLILLDKKKIKTKFLILDILFKIDKGYLTAEIYKMLGLSPQRFRYYLNKYLIENELIEKEYRTLGGVKYKLTEKGERIKKFFIQYGKQLESGYIRLHHIIFKIPIIKHGQISAQKIWETKNIIWYYNNFNKNVSYKWNHSNLFVMVKSIYSNNISEAINTARTQVDHVVEFLESKGFKFDKSKIEISRRPHVAIIDPHINEISKTIFDALKLEASSEESKIDASEGFGEYEIVGKKEDMNMLDLTKYVETAQRLPQKVVQLENDLNIIKNELIPAIHELSKQIKLHLEATKEWKQTASEIRDALKRLIEVLDKK